MRFDYAEFVRVIDDPKAPERLRGQTITVTVDRRTRKLEFNTQVPDDATPQEIGYLKWFIGEFVDKLKENQPGVIGEQYCELRKEK